MNGRLPLLLVLLAGVSLLNGCSFLFGNEGYFRSRSMDYQAAEQSHPMVLPPETEVVARPDIYPIPDIRAGDYYQPAEIDEVPRPESLLNVNEDAGIELVSDGKQSWLVVEKPLPELWEDLALFFKASGIRIEQFDEEQKTMETAWLQPKKKPAEGFWDSVVDFFSWDRTPYQREKFLVRVVPWDTQDQYRVTVNHIRVDLDDGELPENDSIDWQAPAEDPELVSAMYDEITSYLSDDEVRFRRSSLFSQNLTSQAKFLLTRDGNDYPVLVIQQDFNRAWIAVTEAIDQSDLIIADRNRSLGIFYLNFGKNEEGEPAQYQLKLNRAENGIQVAVQVSDDQVAPKTVSDDILNKIKEKL